MNTVQLQFSEMLQRGVIPFLEYELFDGEFLTVEIQATEEGLRI